MAFDISTFAGTLVGGGFLGLVGPKFVEKAWDHFTASSKRKHDRDGDVSAAKISGEAQVKATKLNADVDMARELFRRMEAQDKRIDELTLRLEEKDKKLDDCELRSERLEHQLNESRALVDVHARELARLRHENDEQDKVNRNLVHENGELTRRVINLADELNALRNSIVGGPTVRPPPSE